VDGATAVVRGHNGGRLVSRGSAPARELDDVYLMLLRRDPDGAWRISHLMWHRASSPPREDGLPPLGARVRVRTGGASWEEGMLDRTRTEPACYVVLLFKPRAIPTAPVEVASSVPFREVTALEVDRGELASIRSWAGLPAPSGTSWQSVSLKVLLEAGAGCLE
jgi:hypothetical protein